MFQYKYFYTVMLHGNKLIDPYGLLGVDSRSSLSELKKLLQLSLIMSSVIKVVMTKT